MPYADPAAQKAYFAEYGRNNREKRRVNAKFSDAARHANQRAAKYGAPGRLRAKDVRLCLAVGKCYYCKSADLLGIDHLIPLFDKGPNTPTNIVACCHACNASKWRGDAPYAWSRDSDSCIDCGTTDGKHKSDGRCTACYIRWRNSKDGLVKEIELLDAVLEICAYLNLPAAHFRPARTKHGWRTAVQAEGVGWPDLTIAGTRVIFRELKTETGRLSSAQSGWLAALTEAGQDAGVWRPQDLASGRIVAELQAIRVRPRTAVAG
jgi:hypothetical protein